MYRCFLFVSARPKRNTIPKSEVYFQVFFHISGYADALLTTTPEEYEYLCYKCSPGYGANRDRARLYRFKGISDVSGNQSFIR